jgi:uncharacterized protein YoxC
LTDSSDKKTEEHEEGHLLIEDDASVSSLEKIYEVFAASARRWEAIVYPSLFAFIILAVYGFYLIFSLTMDVDRVVTEMKAISGSMVSISKDINGMTDNVALMSDNVNGMLTSMQSMDAELSMQLVEMRQLNKNFTDMNQSVHVMTLAVNQMRRDMTMMNQNVSRPMNFMNSFMPW